MHYCHVFSDDLLTNGHHSDPSQFDSLMADFEAFFEGEEEQGPEVHTDLARIVNASLRRRPHDESVRKTMAKIHIPGNVKNLKVPATNPDVTKALRKGASIADYNIRKAQLALSKGMIPLLTWLHDYKTGKRQFSHAVKYDPWC